MKKSSQQQTPPRRARTEPDAKTTPPTASTPKPDAEPVKPVVQSSDQHPADAQPELKPRRKKEEMVSVTIPKGFHLTDDEGVRHTYSPGIQDMPKAHAEHWYAKAHDVEINP